MRHADVEGSSSMVARVSLILNAFDHAGTLLRLDHIASRTGLPRSSTHRILTQLHATGLVEHRADGYRLAAAAVPASGDHQALRRVAAPVLERLQSDTMLVVHLGVLVGADVHCLDKIAGSSGIVVPFGVGGRTPAHASALGKAALAQTSAEDIDALLDRTLRKITPATIADLPTLHHELARVRARHGLAYDDQELVVGLASVAAAIRTPAGEIAGLSLTGPAPAERLKRVAPFLTRAARGIADRLGDAAAPTGAQADLAAVTDDMLSRVLRTLSSDDWV
ncbi:IclR family transcriptional regulator [Mycobacterium sp. PSTR-4-N]|uniref:IclR family transcriptional regulator n=1 Tax=Mycobacterium sp. PSTR-4-N TaxID=2917745 RepID=UPI001F155402|nr:IclR family transcriptional regulator [Mycobacterium sp. PSTR-4-N]MCG7595978.1 IclR family transcriptional regulator [Mycobacterium sp. PSTR-4-N]